MARRRRRRTATFRGPAQRKQQDRLTPRPRSRPKGQSGPIQTIPRTGMPANPQPTTPTGTGGGGTAPGQSPGAAPPPIPGRTFDSQYTVDVAGARLGFQTNAAQLGLNYGMQVQYDAQGNPIGFEQGDGGRYSYDTGFGPGGQVDTRNPYSQAMMLQRYYQQGQRGTSAAMAARGQLYSGARQNQLDEGTFDYTRNRTNLQTQSTRAYEDATLGAQGLIGGYNQGVAQAQASQSGRWQDAQNEWYTRYGS